MDDTTDEKTDEKQGWQSGTQSTERNADRSAENFSVMQTIGGPLGIIESVAPTLVFMVAYMIVRTVTVPVICSLGLSVAFCLYRLIRRQKIRAALIGLLLAVICALAALKTSDARNFYVPGFFVNAFWLIVLLATLLARVPAIGLIVRLFTKNSAKAESSGGFVGKRAEESTVVAAKSPNARNSTPYRAATWLWAGMFALRLVLEIPLWALHLSTALGVVRMLTGIPLFALVVWLTWIIVQPALVAQESKSRGMTSAQK